MQKAEKFEFSKNEYNDIQPIELDRVTLREPDFYRFDKTDMCALYYISEGESEVVRGGRKTRAKAGTMMFSRHGEGAAFTPAPETTAVIFRLVFRFSNAERLSVLPDEAQYVSDTIPMLWSDVARTSLPEEAAISKIFEVMYTIKRLSLIKKSEKNYVARACAYIDDNYASKLSVSSIAESLSINRQYLTRLFHQKKGVSVQQYIINTRLGKSREILDAGYSVAETASMVGYGDQFGFTRIFSKKYGMSPTKYKSRNKDE